MRALLLASSLFCIAALHAQPKFEIEYQTVSNFNVIYHDAIVTVDEDFIFPGTYGEGSGTDIVVTKLDKEGSLDWSYIYEGPADYNYSRAISQTPDSGYVVAGYGNYSGATHIMIFKIDSAGVLEWDNAYYLPTPGTVGTWDMTTDAIGNIYVTGGGCGEGASFILKLDPMGQSLWLNTYMEGNGAGIDIKMASDGNIIIAGTANGSTQPSYLKIDPAGNILHAYRYQTASLSGGAGFLTELSNGQVLMNTNLSGGGNSNKRCVLTMLDSTGIVSWQKQYHFDNYPDDFDEAFSFVEIEQNRIVVGARHVGSSILFPQRTIFVIDFSGNVLWEASPGTTTLFQAAAVLLGNGADGDLYALAGAKFPRFLRMDLGMTTLCHEESVTVSDSTLHTTSIVDEQTWSFLSDTTACSFVRTNMNLIEAEICYDSLYINSTEGLWENELQTFDCYPNPASDEIHFDLNDVLIEELIIRDVTGKNVFHASEHIESVNVSNFDEGVYFVLVRSDRGQYRSKFQRLK